jgi:hypothetical protein
MKHESLFNVIWRNSARADKSKRFRERLITVLLILALMVAMAGWIAGLAWIGYLVVKRLF